MSYYGSRGGPGRATRLAISLFVVLHFLAILTAVTSASSANFSAPGLAVWASRPFQPYGDRALLGLAVGTPVTRPKLFDVEALVNFNWRF
jgi:hypothetical protein